MDDSMSSTNYMSNSCSSKDITCSEESGWTLYLDNFDFEDGSFFSGYESSSMVSDAACSAVRNPGDNDLCRNRDNMMSRKRRAKATLVDQELEDTASSPSHSPKVCELNNLYMSSKGLDSRNVYQAYNSNHHQNQQTYDRSVIFEQKKGFISQQTKGIVNMDCMETQLKRKGLCLVPMSMLLGYNLS